MNESTIARRPLSALPFVNGFARLPQRFHARLSPTPLPDPYLIAVSEPACALIGLDPEEFRRPEVLAAFTGNAVPQGAEPLAAVYAGHQFGVWAGRLGDGRAIVLGEVTTPEGGGMEIQLKGAGKTPFSRMGDGRAVLRSSIREYLCSEAMDALGIPTTRALCLTGSDHPVFRETVETAAVVTRLSPSFVRFGSFEHFYYGGEHDALRQLAEFVIERHYPGLQGGPAPFQALLAEVTARTARLVAQWQAVGFCHGVMNTDNMSILGLTIDYGPFGFLDGFDAMHVCNHSDHQGRYAYARQPGIAEWNCYALGQALVPLIGSPAETEAALAGFRDVFAAELRGRMRAKLGLQDARDDAVDDALIERVFAILHEGRVDMTTFFRRLADLPASLPDVPDGAPHPDAVVRDLFLDRPAFDAWARDWRARLAAEGLPDAERAARMNRVNPKFVLRNHLAEIAIRKARGDDGERDFSEVDRLMDVLRRPFDEQPGNEAYAALPPDWASSLEVSCSS